MSPFVFLQSNLKTRCLYFVPYININGHSYDCTIDIKQDVIIVCYDNGKIFSCYIFDVMRITDCMFYCISYDVQLKRFVYVTLIIPDFDDEDDDLD